MSSSFWLLQVESCDFFQAEIERSACKAEQIHKMTTIFTRQPRTILSENSCHFVNLLSFASSSFFFSLRKITWLNLQQPKTRGHVEHLSISLWMIFWQNWFIEKFFLILRSLAKNYAFRNDGNKMHIWLQWANLFGIFSLGFNRAVKVESNYCVR